MLYNEEVLSRTLYPACFIMEIYRIACALLLFSALVTGDLENLGQEGVAFSLGVSTWQFFSLIRRRARFN